MRISVLVRRLLFSFLLTAILIEVALTVVLRFHLFSETSVHELPLPPPSPYEIPGSLAQVPELRPLSFPQTPTRVFEESRFQFEDGVWLPERNQNADVEMLDHETKQVVRRVHVTTDAHARRIPSWQSAREATAKRHRVFFGCSITWGYGVNDDETYPALMAKNSPDVITYNLASGGYGLGELLLRAQKGDSLDAIGPKNGIGVYALFEGHLRRFYNSSFVAASWRQGGVSVTEPELGRFEFNGPVREAEPLWYWFSRFWNASSMAHFLNLDLPVLNQQRVERFARAIHALRDLYWQKTLQTNPFVVMILPNGFDTRPLRAALEREKIYFIDYSGYPLSTRLQGPAVLPGETHPTPKAHEMLANVLQRDLNAYFPTF